MPKKIELKTKESKQSPTASLNALKDMQKRADAKKLLALFKKATGKPATMWGPSIIGFGSYTYTRSNGDVGEFLATGFSPRAQNLSIYILPGYGDHGDLLKKLGPHKLGKSCLYIKKLEDIDLNVLEQLVKAGLADLKKRYPVK